MSDIFEEVNEDVRRDKATEFFKKYGLYVAAIAVVIVLAVAGNHFWTQYQTSQRQAVSAVFSEVDQLITVGNTDEAVVKLEQAASSYSNEVAYLAEMRLASVLLEQDKPTEALSFLDSAANRMASDITLRDLAHIKIASVILETDGPAAALEALEPLSVSGAPYRLSALELSALAHIELGNTADAEGVLDQITNDPDASTAMLERVGVLRESL